MAPTKLELFLSKPQLTGEMSEVPGLGDVGLENLALVGIKTTYQLLGHFLANDRDEAKMTEFLVEQGNRAQDVRRTAQALCERVAKEGVSCNVRLSAHVVKTTASRFGDDKKTDFVQRKLSGKLSNDFFGISEASEGRFRAAGIHNTDQLFAAFLKIMSDPDPSKNTDKCDEFYRLLDTLGAASGFKSVIIYQLQAKLAVGIDSHGPEALRRALPVLPETDEEEEDEEAYDRRTATAAPGTGGSTRRAEPRAAAAGGSRRKLFEPAAAPSGGRSSGANFLLSALPVLGAMGFFYFFLAAQSTADPAALPMPGVGAVMESQWL